MAKFQIKNYILPIVIVGIVVAVFLLRHKTKSADVLSQQEKEYWAYKVKDRVQEIVDEGGTPYDLTDMESMVGASARLRF